MAADIGTRHARCKAPEAGILDLLRQLLLIPAVLVIAALALTLGAFVALMAERGKPARLTRKEIGALTRESVARALLWVTAPLGWGLPAPARTPGADDPSLAVPVLLVPGAPQGRHALGPLAVFLRKRGFHWVWTVPSGRGPLADRFRECRRSASATKDQDRGHVL